MYCNIPCDDPKAFSSNPSAAYELIVLCSTGLYTLDRDCKFSLLHDYCINEVANETFVNATDIITVRGTTMVVVTIGVCHIAYIDMEMPENCHVAYSNPGCSEKVLNQVVPTGKLDKVTLASTGPGRLFVHPGQRDGNRIFVLLFSNMKVTTKSFPERAISSMAYTAEPQAILHQDGDGNLQRVLLTGRSEMYLGNYFGFKAPFLIDTPVDGNWSQTSFAGMAVKLEMPNTNTMLYLEVDGSIRVLDTAGETSRSICHSTNSSLPVLGPITECAFPHGASKDIYTLPEYNSILVLSGKQILAFGYHHPLQCE